MGEETEAQKSQVACDSMPIPGLGHALLPSHGLERPPSSSQEPFQGCLSGSRHKPLVVEPLGKGLLVSSPLSLLQIHRLGKTLSHGALLGTAGGAGWAIFKGFGRRGTVLGRKGEGPGWGQWGCGGSSAESLKRQAGPGSLLASVGKRFSASAWPHWLAVTCGAPRIICGLTSPSRDRQREPLGAASLGVAASPVLCSGGF